MILMCQCRFVLGNKCSNVSDVGNGRGYGILGVGGEWEISVFSPQSIVNLKLIQKMKSL